jgi:hypothetical protein
MPSLVSCPPAPFFPAIALQGQVHPVQEQGFIFMQYEG